MLYGYGVLNNHVPTLKATVMKIGAAISTLLTGLYAVYKAEGNNNLSLKNAWNGNGDAVDSKSGNNGTIATPSGTTWVAGSMTYGSGKLGSGAFTFNGSNFVSLPADSLNFTTDFSVSAWIYVPTAFGTNISRIISCFDNQTSPTTYRGWEVVYNNGTVKLQIYPNGSTYYIISVPMTLKDQWVHVTAVRIAGQQGEIYINGVAGTKTVSANGATSASAIAYGTGNLAYIGALYDSGLSPCYSVTPAGGFKIDSVQTWNGSALSSSAVTELYNSGNGQEYPFTLSSVMIPTANDALATYNGTAGGGLTYTAGMSGNAFDFNGTNAFVELPENTLSLSTNFSLSFWMYTIANATTSVISNFGNDGVNRGFYIDQDGTQSLRFVAFNNTAVIVTSGTGTIQLNQWQHFVFNCNAGVGQWYINGSSIGSPNNISQTYISNSKPLIGAFRTGNTGGKSAYRNMKLDEFTAWNKALTLTEVTELYNSGIGKFYPY